MLKLRASYGISGSDDISNYASLAYYIPANYQLMGGYRPGNLRNPDLKWETTAQMDVGVDLSVFSQRLNLYADYYIKITSDLLTHFSTIHFRHHDIADNQVRDNFPGKLKPLFAIVCFFCSVIVPQELLDMIGKFLVIFNDQYQRSIFR